MQGPPVAKIGLILTRVVVPAWILTGALFKLQAGTPANLPQKTILALAAKIPSLDLYYLLAGLVGLELMAVAVMLCLTRLARPMALFMLSVFCLILVGEMVQGNVTSCGCLGDVKLPPWAMFAIDGVLLAGVAICDPSPILPARPAAWPRAVAALLIVVGFALSYLMLIPEAAPPPPVPTPVGPGTTGNGDPAPAPTVQLPSYYFTSDVDGWVGRPWREIDLFGFMATQPENLDRGKRYVVFYGRNCDHCDEMFHLDLVDPTLGSMTTAVAVPVSKTSMLGDDPWPMPPTACELLELPLGLDWIITTPLTLTIEDGIVTCADEGSHTRCMGLEQE